MEIKRDDLENPRGGDCENLGKMVCWHRRYRLGDEMPKKEPHEWYETNLKGREGAIYLPLFLLDHSGITMRTASFRDPWDSGQVGWIYATEDEIKSYFSHTGEMTEELKERALKVLETEVRLYDNYLTGDVWCCSDGDEVFGGFYGSTLEETGLFEHFGEDRKKEVEEAWEKRI